jgi:hypothetical protein
MGSSRKTQESKREAVPPVLVVDWQLEASGGRVFFNRKCLLARSQQSGHR